MFDENGMMARIDKVTKNFISHNETVTKNTRFSDLGASSLEKIEIIMGLEDEFGVTFKNEEEIETVGEALDTIKREIRDRLTKGKRQFS